MWDDPRDDLEKLGLVPAMPAYQKQRGTYTSPDQVTMRTMPGGSMAAVIPTVDARIPAVVIPALRNGAGEGLHIACDPHDPEDQKVLIDPDKHRDHPLELDLRKLSKTQTTAVLQAVQAADYEGEFMRQGHTPEEAKRMVASLVAQALAAAQDPEKQAQVGTPSPPVPTSWPTTSPTPTATRGPQFPSYLGKPAARTASAAPAAATRVPDATVPVAFSIPGFGTHIAHYHEVIISEEGNVMALCYDRRYSGNKFFPDTTMQDDDGLAPPTTIRARIGDSPVIYHLIVPKITLVSQDKELYIVMIHELEEPS